MNNHSSLTKIIATMGPACSSKENLTSMFKEGLDVCRINFSHGAYEDHKITIDTIREINEEFGLNIAILGDLQGPKLRVGNIENNRLDLIAGDILTFTNQNCLGTKEHIYMSYQNFPSDVSVGEIIMIDDGKLKLEVVSTNGKDQVKAMVLAGGPLSSKKGVNLPNTKISLPSLTEKDIADVHFAVENNLDWLALSFVRSVVDIIELKDLLKTLKSNLKIIAKIEKPEALKEIDDIIDLSNGIMVARGDLGVEVPFNMVPVIQKDIIKRCLEKAKPVIVATQMMESMITNFRPTRAEANDVANAVLDGADAVMLSGETSVGAYPVEAIKSMKEIIHSTAGKGYEKMYNFKPSLLVPTFMADSICYNAAKLARQVSAKAIIINTYSGYTALRISSHRPETDIFAFTGNQPLVKQLNLVWGLKAFGYEAFSNINDFVEYSIKFLKDKGIVESGDLVVHVSSIPIRDKGQPNMLKISMID